MKRETKQLLYTFQHDWFPQLFYRQQEALTAALINDGETVHRILTSLAGEAGVECPIEAAELPVEVLGYPIDRYVIKIAFPEPDQDPLCHFVCLCFDKGFTDMRYLTVEKSAGIDGDTRPFLCGWTRDGRHENYGQCELEEALDRCVGLYLGEYKVEYLNDSE